MKCQHVRELLALLPYGDTTADEEAEVHRHLDGCPECRAVFAEFGELTHALDSVSTPEVRVDVEAIHRETRTEEVRTLRRWKRAAVALAAVAAGLLLLLVFRFDLSWQDRQLVIGWGRRAEPVATPSPPPRERAAPQPSPVVSVEEFELIRELVHALAADVETRGDDQREALERLETRLNYLQHQVRRNQQDVRAMYSDLYLSKGE